MANHDKKTDETAVQRKRILLICRHAPYGAALARAALDAALANAAFEQDVSLLFMDDGVWQLQPGQDAGVIGQKNIEATLQSLPLYDLNNIHVDAHSLQQRALDPEQLTGDLVILEQQDLAAFIDAHDQVIGF